MYRSTLKVSKVTTMLSQHKQGIPINLCSNGVLIIIKTQLHGIMIGTQTSSLTPPSRKLLIIILPMVVQAYKSTVNCCHRERHTLCNFMGIIVTCHTSFVLLVPHMQGISKLDLLIFLSLLLLSLFMLITCVFFRNLMTFPSN